MTSREWRKPLPGREGPDTRIERDRSMRSMREIMNRTLRTGFDQAARVSGAGDGNRTRVSSLEG
jgi:hypothetical protein